MNFFQFMDQALVGFDVTFVIAKNHDTPDGKLTVSVLPKYPSQNGTLKPFTINATAEELDANYEELFIGPAQAITSLAAQSKAFASEVKAKQEKDAADKAKKSATTTPSKPGVKNNAVVTPEQKAKGVQVEKIMKQAEEYATKKNYFAAIGFFKEALKIFPDNIQANKRLKEVEELYKKPVVVDMFAQVIEPVTVDVSIVVEAIKAENPIPETSDIPLEEPEETEDDPQDNENPDEDEENLHEEFSITANDQICDPNA